MRLRPIFVIHIIALIITMPASWAKTEIDAKISKKFDVIWNSIRYYKTLYNTAIPTNNSIPVESLLLSCQVNIHDPNTTLGICSDGIITELEVDNGRKINVHRYTPDIKRMSYDGLHYRNRYVQPPRPSRWQTFLRSVLRLQQPPLSQRINELQPSEMNIQLEVGLLGSDNSQISSIKGYFYALMAESIEYIDVPYEPNVNWVSLTPDINIQVRKAECRTSGTRLSYNLDIAVQTPGRNSTNILSVVDSPPSRIVVDRQLIGKDGKPIDVFRGYRRLPANVGGSSSGSYSDSGGVIPIEKIRFVIAVNPTHRKIPFELKNILLPNP